MKLAGSFFRLIRYPNLLFMVITQFLFYFCILSPAIHPNRFFAAEFYLLTLLSLSTVLIAAGGYIINDYFDVKIDLINKHDEVIIDRIIPRRWAILWHLVLSGAGIMVGAYISWFTHNWLIALSNIACVILLWLYSTTFKKKLLSGNIIISALTAWVIMVVFFFTDYFSPGLLPDWRVHENLNNNIHRRLIRISFLYAGFAFVISLVREVIKDLEDMEGDAKYGCKTMPLEWGIPVAKVFTGVWLMVLIGALLSIQFYAMYLGWWWSILYCMLLIVIPLVSITKKLYRATNAAHFSELSRSVKLVMLTGIISMVFFKIYQA